MNVMRKVYLLKIFSFNRTTQFYEMYDIEVYSSKKAREEGYQTKIRINNGFDVEIDESLIGTKMITYKTISTDENVMSLRYVYQDKILIK